MPKPLGERAIKDVFEGVFHRFKYGDLRNHVLVPVHVRCTDSHCIRDGMFIYYVHLRPEAQDGIQKLMYLNTDYMAKWIPFVHQRTYDRHKYPSYKFFSNYWTAKAFIAEYHDALKRAENELGRPSR